jgi:hypothetical protein
MTQLRRPSIRSNHLQAGAAQVAAPGRILMAFKHAAVLGGIAALLSTMSSAQAPGPANDDPRVPHYAIAFEFQQIMAKCRIANLPVTPAELQQKVAQLATAIGPAVAKQVRDEISGQPVECPPAAEIEGFKAVLTLVATKSSEEVAKALDAPDQAPPGGPPPGPRR